jgi:hypothetical protein
MDHVENVEKAMKETHFCAASRLVWLWAVLVSNKTFRKTESEPRK